MQKTLKFEKAAGGGALVVTLLAGAILTLPNARAEVNVVDRVTITVSPTCSMTGTVNTEHTKNVLNGHTESNIGTTTIETFCNDGAGYAIYAIGYTDNVEGRTVLKSASLGSTYDISTSATVTSGTSSWAMKLAKAGSAYLPIIVGSTDDTEKVSSTPDFSDYAAVPNEYTRVAYYPYATDTDTNVAGSALTTTYRAYISGSQPAGTYVGQVKYLLVHPSTEMSFSSEGVTAVFQAYPGDSIEFSDGSTTNTVIFRQMCTDPEDSSTCTFVITDGEYKNPVDYKGAWLVPIPDGSGGYSMETFEIQNGADEWIAGLNSMDGSAFLGETVPIYAYNGNAIVYDGNGATAGDMSSVASRFESGSATLIAPNFKKTGYGFAGWSTSSSATVNSGTIYGPNQTITTSDVSFDSNGTETMYAVWVASSGNLQSFSCSSLASGAVTALTDTRDGNVYTVGKMADGKCWMMENLRLDGSATLTSSNTNNPAISSVGSSQNSWCTDYDANCINQSVINTNNVDWSGTAFYSQANGGVDSLWYGYGNYYNWYAATAGNGTYEVNSEETVIAGDVCPAGWSLPSGGVGGQFSALDSAIGGTGSWQDTEVASNRWRSYPLNYVYSGGWSGSSAGGRSDDGHYWSRTASGSGSAYDLDFYSDYVDPGTVGDNEGSGQSVRCVSQ